MNEYSENCYDGRILYVDEDIAMQRVMESILKADRFQVVNMPSAEDGLELLEIDDSFDFVITGYTLPGMNGFRFLHQVARLYPKSMRVLMSGGYADSDEVDQAISDGYISRYVSKPFCISAFREELQADLAAARANVIAN